MLPRVLTLGAGSSGLNRWLEPQVLREYLIGAESAGAFEVAAFKDPAVARVVELLRTRPAESWTVASLAAEVAMSRALSGTRFREVVGESPIRMAEWTSSAVAASS